MNDGTALAAIERPVSLFASALAARPLTLRLDDTPADAATLVLPPALLAGHRGDGPWGEMRLEVLREVVQRQLGGRWGFELAQAAARGLLGPQAAGGAGDDLVRCLASWPRPRLLRRLWQIVDRGRVDARIALQYPGARAELQQSRAATLARLQSLHPRHPLRQVLHALQCQALGAAPLLGAEATAYDSLQAALDIAARCFDGDARGAAVPHALRLADTEAATSAHAAGNGSATDGTQGRADRGAAGASQASVPTATAASDPGRARGNGAAVAGHPVPGAAARPRAGAARHDEWHYLERRYLRGWTTVHEQRLRGTDLGYLHQLRQRHGELAAAIRRRIGPLRPQRHERLHRMPDGEHIDLDAAIEARIERRAGQALESRVYTSTRAARRDVGAVFLLDVSGSTGFALPDVQAADAADTDDDGGWFFARSTRPQPPPRPLRRVIDVAKDAIGLMCDTLARLGDRHAVYGFSGEGRHQVDFYVAKGFDESWSAHSAAALAALEPKGSTRSGAAIRHALGKLRDEPAQTRLLILLTDGYPQDSDYGPDPQDIEYGLRDTAQAMHEAERAGIAVFCVSVDHAAHDYLRRVCAPSRYLVIDDVQALPEQLSKVYRRLTR
jgi:nitric oxide reductase NorD protein